MVRARLAFLTLPATLLVLTGCSMPGSNSGASSGSGFFSFLHGSRSRGMDCPVGCDCGEMSTGMSGPHFSEGYASGGCSNGACSAGPLISNAHPSFVEGPSLFPPNPTPMTFPGNAMPPAAFGPRPAPLPPVVTIPQAAPTASPP